MLLVSWALFGHAAVQSPREQRRATRAKTAQDSLPNIDVNPRQDAAAAERDLQKKEALEDSILNIVDSAVMAPAAPKPQPRDTTAKKSFLDDVISGKNQDSLIYEPGNKMVYIYEKGDIDYQTMNLKADYIRVNMETKIIYAYGRMDSATVDAKGDTIRKPTRPEFNDAGHTYTMDTITYNLGSKKAKIKGVATQEGEGWLIGDNIKKMPNNYINIAHGKYTTCDHVENPHFYLYMTKAKAIPGKKIIVGPSYLVFEDVPIYFLGVPFAFFPMSSGRQSGFIVPSYGEEMSKGFFIRDGGYYFAFNDYLDATVTAGIYTLGSWGAAASSRYIKRYRYSGSLALNYSKDILGDKGDADYVNMNNYSLQWTHSQDPKFRPGSTFSASVNISSSGYSKYAATNMNDYLSSQTNSSISYSKAWSKMSLSASFSHSQNSRDKSISFTLPNVAFSVQRIYPFKRREVVGKERWYEKIGLTYTSNLSNSISTYDSLLFTEKTLKEMKSNVTHNIPISASFSLFKYINLTPSISYGEYWSFKKVEQKWDPAAKQVITGDTTYGFYRVPTTLSASVGTSTKIYGTFQFKNKNFPIQAIRHMMTPEASFSFSPDLSDPRFGYYERIQSDSLGGSKYYSPYERAPSRGKSASVSFSLGNTLEMKVKSKDDTTGVKKIKIIEQLSARSSWNFLADSMNLEPFSLSLRTGTLFGNFAIQLNAMLDPYQLDEQGRRINKFMLSKGKLGRITSTGWTFGYTFQSSQSAGGAMNDINNSQVPVDNPNAGFFSDPTMDAAVRRQLMTSQYYDFNIPWNFGFNYGLDYKKPAYETIITQTLGFNGSVTLTEKWGITFSGSYNFESKKVDYATFNLTRDLHCWQMNFTWIPLGFRQSWSFNIGVKSAMLKDLKYDKHNSYFDNLYGN